MEVLISIIIGVIAILLPVINIIFKKKINGRLIRILPVVSMSLCSLSILVHLFMHQKYAIAGKVDTIEDVIWGSITGAIFLIGICSFLNIIASLTGDKE